MSFGEKLAKLRKNAGMNQEELANKLNVSRQAVSKWESNSSYPETDKIVAICKLFNCSMDELMGVDTKEEEKQKEAKIDNKIFKTINNYFDMFLKGINMFFSMTFKQKIICLIEIGIYAIILILALALLRILIIEVFSKIFSSIPFGMKSSLIDIIDGLYLIVCIIVFIYAIFKLYKIRYLDYYNSSDNEKEVIIETSEEKININNEKIILRDPSNAYKPFNWLKRACIIFIKFMLSFVGFGLTIAFVIFIALLFINLYFVDVGPIAIYTALGIIGGIIFVYCFMEMIIRFIFNKKEPFIRLFIMIIISLIIFGVSGGLFTCELTKFTIIEEDAEASYKVSEEVINMEDNLILRLQNVEVVLEDRNDLMIEVYANSNDANLEVKKYENTEEPCDNITSNIYLIKHYYLGFDNNRRDISEYLDRFRDALKRKELIVDDYLYYRTVLHISKENYQKLRVNEKTLDYQSFNCE